MKVLLINKFFHYVGGSETYFFGLAKMLEEQGHEVIFFSMKDDRNPPCEQEKYFVENVDYNAPMSKIQMAKAGLSVLYSFEAKRKLEQLIIDEKPDVAHLNLFQSQLTGSIVDVLYKYHIPMVYTIHDLKMVCPTYLFMSNGKICRECMKGCYLPCIKKRCMKGSLMKSILAAAESRVYRIKKTYDKIDLIIAPSEHHKKYALQSGVTKTKIICMRNFLPENVKLTESITVGDYFLYFGRLSEEKGILTLLRAYAMSKVESPLYIAGSGLQEDEIRQMITELHLEEKVKMLGFKSGDELVQLVHDAKCIILPSECAENAPYSILESMAAGKPIIVANNGGLPELVRVGKNGFISEPGNPQDLALCIEKMESMTGEQLLEMGKEAQKMVVELADPRKYVEKITNIYISLFEK